MFRAHVRYKRVTPLCALLLGLSLLVGCLPDPQRAQSVELWRQLVSARAEFSTDMQQACDDVGEVQTRLYGEPGLRDTQTGWPSLRDAAAALQTVCGQRTLLAQGSNGSPALEAARENWQAGVDREMAIACDHLRAAAHELGQPEAC